MADRSFMIRNLREDEILSEEDACKREHPVFLPLWETAISEISRKYLRTRARLKNIFVGSLENQVLLVETPEFLAVVWRLWYGEQPLQVVRVSTNGNMIKFEPGVINIPASQVAECVFIVDRILTELPPWLR